MNKMVKLMLLLFGLLTVLTVIASVVMLLAVSGDGLLTLHSDLGAIYAHSYRWVTLAAGVMVFAWAILLYSKRRSWFNRPKRERKAAVSDASAASHTTASHTAVSEEKGGSHAL